jgi:hypothetical protein
VDWTEDDELGPKEDGWSLHLTREDAEAFIAGFVSPHAGHSSPYKVEVPKQVLEALRATKKGSYYPRPRECPYPVVRSHERDAKASSLGNKAAIVVVIVAFLSLPVAFEQEWLSTPAGQAEATIIGVQDEKLQGKRSPAWFRHRVSLPDGSRAVFVSDRVHQPGSRILATVSRGRITGRTWLTAPYRLVGGPDRSSGARQ